MLNGCPHQTTTPEGPGAAFMGCLQTGQGNSVVFITTPLRSSYQRSLGPGSHPSSPQDGPKCCHTYDDRDRCRYYPHIETVFPNEARAGLCRVEEMSYSTFDFLLDRGLGIPLTPGLRGPLARQGFDLVDLSFLLVIEEGAYGRAKRIEMLRPAVSGNRGPLNVPDSVPIHNGQSGRHAVGAAFRLIGPAVASLDIGGLAAQAEAFARFSFEPATDFAAQGA